MNAAYTTFIRMRRAIYQFLDAEKPEAKEEKRSSAYGNLKKLIDEKSTDYLKFLTDRELVTLKGMLSNTDVYTFLDNYTKGLV